MQSCLPDCAVTLHLLYIFLRERGSEAQFIGQVQLFPQWCSHFYCQYIQLQHFHFLKAALTPEPCNSRMQKSLCHHWRYQSRCHLSSSQLSFTFFCPSLLCKITWRTSLFPYYWNIQVTSGPLLNFSNFTAAKSDSPCTPAYLSSLLLIYRFALMASALYFQPQAESLTVPLLMLFSLLSLCNIPH